MPGFLFFISCFGFKRLKTRLLSGPPFALWRFLSPPGRLPSSPAAILCARRARVSRRHAAHNNGCQRRRVGIAASFVSFVDASGLHLLRLWRSAPAPLPQTAALRCGSAAARRPFFVFCFLLLFFLNVFWAERIRAVCRPHGPNVGRSARLRTAQPYCAGAPPFCFSAACQGGRDTSGAGAAGWHRPLFVCLAAPLIRRLASAVRRRRRKVF